MADAASPVGVAGANMTPHIDGDHVKEVEPWPEDAPGLVALTPGSLRGPAFSPSQEAALDDVKYVPGSSDIADLGTEELGLLGYPTSATLAHQLEASSGGCRVDVFTGCDRAPTPEGDVGRDWSGCSTTGLAQS
jgi:hypothetical protein